MAGLRPSKKTGAADDAAPSVEGKLTVRAPEVVTIVRWTHPAAPRKGRSAAGIFHNGREANIEMIDGYVSLDPNMDPVELSELEISLSVAGFVRESISVPKSMIPGYSDVAEETEAPAEEEQVDLTEDDAEPKQELGGGTSYEREITNPEDAEGAEWTLQHPDAEGPGIGPTVQAQFPVGGVMKDVKVESGRVITKDKALKDYLIAIGYILEHTEIAGM